ncbi:2-oxoadipate dehydrogenase complex component E1-like [Lineus longissimus]|uniref:2-oxoadipate dehydrogenase complex component E1-like n=1 Tax=Lineus longissimus TaxID=88925 RepID=UPI002B4DBF01
MFSQNNIRLSTYFHRFASCQRFRSYHSKTGVHGFRPKTTQKSVGIPDAEAIENRISSGNLFRLVTAYREHGHKEATLDPLKLAKRVSAPELELSHYGLAHEQATLHDLHGILNTGVTTATTSDVIQKLREIYCGTVAVEFQQLQSLEEREWFAQRYEETRHEPIPPERKVALAKLMLKCQAYDHFLASKFPTVKRYGGEGAESMMMFFEEVFSASAQAGIQDIVMCMPHRGRNNLLTCMLNFPMVVMLQKMKGKREFPPGVKGSGDVLSHLSISTDLKYGERSVHVSLIPNPSHLEANNPVCVGKARSRQRRLGDGDYTLDESVTHGDKVLCVQVHGDGSVAAQGVVAETFSIAYTPHFRVGGSIHLAVNNQVAFTTEPERGRSSMYCSDVAKMIGCPVIHVNGDDPEEVIRATRLAMEYRDTFRKDVFVDLVCFRRWGHNELDEASFTQPLMYQVINNKASVPDQFRAQVVNEGLCGDAELEECVNDWQKHLNDQIKLSESHVPKADHLEKQWSGFSQAPDSISKWETGVSPDLLKYVGAKSVSVPEDFALHPNIHKTHVGRRIVRLEEGTGLDWSTAEALAFGSLLSQGFNVRISGQDVGRGTFSHRHAMLVDQKTDDMYIPLNHMYPDQKTAIEVSNSALSEEAVLGFEYGISIDDPNTLAIWEAQFGDFFNGAQPIIDTYVCSGETKWLRQSGLVILLPHGMDGAGPEHSSCRMERFLQMTDSKETGIDGDDVNFQLANPTTSAQYFHLLRRQMVRNFRKPLIMAAPKMILRFPAAGSSLAEMAPGTAFQTVIGDTTVDPSRVTRVVICCGKHYYALDKHRGTENINDVAIIRLEELCPFPVEDIRNELNKYKNAKEFVWSQEEHRNMGAWSFINPRFEKVVGTKLNFVGRDVLAAPATGVGEIHKQEAEMIIKDAFAKL